MTKKKTSKATKITAKQRKFYMEFPKDMNATQAAIRAGYSKKSAPVEGCKLLKTIRQHVKEAKTEPNVSILPALTDQTKDEYTQFLTRLRQLAFVDVRKMFDQHNNAIDIPDLPDDVAPAIAGFEITEEFEGRGADRKSIGVTKKVKLVDPRAAILALSKVRGFFPDKDERPQSPLEKVPTKNVMMDDIRRSPAGKRRMLADKKFFRRWLKRVDGWKKHPRHLSVTFPGIKDGDRLAEELVQFARDVVAGLR